MLIWIVLIDYFYKKNYQLNRSNSIFILQIKKIIFGMHPNIRKVLLLS